MKIIPAILTSDIEEFGNLLAQVAREYDRVQIDFVDGEFALNKSIKIEECKSIKNFPEIKFDAHLMVTETNLQGYLKNLEYFDRTIVQMESIYSPEDFDCLALDINSPVEAIKPYLPKLKLVNLMSIEPGLGGQKLDLRIFDHLSYLSNLRNLSNLKFKISVDGGVEPKHLEKLELLGANEVVVGAFRVLSWK